MLLSLSLSLSLSLNWLDSVLQLELQTSHFVIAQLLRLCVATGAPSSHFVVTLAQFCVATGATNLSFLLSLSLCCNWSSAPLILLSLSLNRLDSVLQLRSKPLISLSFFLNRLGYVFQLELQTSHLVVTLTQLIRFCIAPAAPNLSLRCHSRSSYWILCCNCSSKRLILLSISLNLLDYVLQLQLQTSHVVATLAQLIGFCVATGAPNLSFLCHSRSID